MTEAGFYKYSDKHKQIKCLNRFEAELLLDSAALSAATVMHFEAREVKLNTFLK